MKTIFSKIILKTVTKGKLPKKGKCASAAGEREETSGVRQTNAVPGEPAGHTGDVDRDQKYEYNVFPIFRKKSFVFRYCNLHSSPTDGYIQILYSHRARCHETATVYARR
ncbi:hypothetical protein EVAR_87113_1 [Eumeta japonica]|uniref:Uncharacterized protein n=1 Tax=Eumeta variegata TaxID=151549 RepID=A0A4C2A063_EUMVA|nr:hypothetical protein EVAR_87113_1 [Eumeta japonica]